MSNQRVSSTKFGLKYLFNSDVVQYCSVLTSVNIYVECATFSFVLCFSQYIAVLLCSYENNKSYTSYSVAHMWIHITDCLSILFESNLLLQQKLFSNNKTMLSFAPRRLEQKPICPKCEYVLVCEYMYIYLSLSVRHTTRAYTLVHILRRYFNKNYQTLVLSVEFYTSEDRDCRKAKSWSIPLCIQLCA